jgi:hypothetical protein
LPSDKEKPYNGGTWTPAKFNSWIKGVLRKGSTRWPPSYQALNDAYVGDRINPKSGRKCKHYLCAGCSKEFPAKEVGKDHIHPVIDPAIGFTNWDDVIQRMFCEKDGFQILCSDCHKVKTDEEREKARERRLHDK